jgi:transposase
MAQLSPEQRKQLASAAAAARWQHVGGASKRAATKSQQNELLARMSRELSELIRQRGILDRKINGLTQAVKSYGGNLPADSDLPAS